MKENYQVLEEQSLYDLDQKVNQLISQGWKPQGGIAVYMKPGKFYSNESYVQAMVRNNA